MSVYFCKFERIFLQIRKNIFANMKDQLSPLENPRTLKLKRPISMHKFGATPANGNDDREYSSAREFSFASALLDARSRVLIKRTVMINHMDGYLHSLFPYTHDRNIPFKRYAQVYNRDKSNVRLRTAVETGGIINYREIIN